MSDYSRVLPRDLFNEAKLLKCLGQLALIVHDGMDKRRRACPPITIEHDGGPFEVCQSEDSGALYSASVAFMVRDMPLTLFSGYNHKGPYPLFCEGPEGEVSVFHDDGSLTDEFCKLCEEVYVNGTV